MASSVLFLTLCLVWCVGDFMGGAAAASGEGSSSDGALTGGCSRSLARPLMVPELQLLDRGEQVRATQEAKRADQPEGGPPPQLAGEMMVGHPSHGTAQLALNFHDPAMGSNPLGVFMDPWEAARNFPGEDKCSGVRCLSEAREPVTYNCPPECCTARRAS
jgi:hypothetical protein